VQENAAARRNIIQMPDKSFIRTFFGLKPKVVKKQLSIRNPFTTITKTHQIIRLSSADLIQLI